jgi:hypothetical protein
MEACLVIVLSVLYPDLQFEEAATGDLLANRSFHNAVEIYQWRYLLS